MATDLWGWFDQVRYEAYQTNNKAILQSIQLYYDGWRCREQNPEQTLVFWQQAKALALQERHACLALFHEYWCCEAYLFYLDDHKSALDAAVRMMVEAHKPRYATCPILARVYRVLLDVFLFTDPFGYADKICDTIRYMQQRLSLDEDTEQLLIGRLAYFATVFDEYDEALELRYRYLEMCEGNHFRLCGGHLGLCTLTDFLGDSSAAYEHAQAAETHARRGDSRSTLAGALAWQAYLSLKRGEAQAAVRLEQEASIVRSRLKTKPSESYYSGCAYYEETRGDYERALAIRRQQLADALDSGQVYVEFRSWAQVCRLLYLMGLPFEEEATKAQATLNRLGDPSIPERRLIAALQGKRIL